MEGEQFELLLYYINFDSLPYIFSKNSFWLQELLQDLEASNHKLESLHSRVDEKLGEKSQKEFQEMKDQVTQLEHRWTQFRRRLTSSIEDNKRAIRRQREFDQEHVKICSVLETVLQGAENTSFDQTDMAVDLGRVEVCVQDNGHIYVKRFV